MCKYLGRPTKQALSILVTKLQSVKVVYDKVTVCSEVRTEHVIALCVQNVDYCCYAFETLMLLE